MVSRVDATGGGDTMLFYVLLFILALPIAALSVFGHLLLHLSAGYCRHRSQRHIALPRQMSAAAQQAA
jgi:hypothetical protein